MKVLAIAAVSLVLGTGAGYWKHQSPYYSCEGLSRFVICTSKSYIYDPKVNSERHYKILMDGTQVVVLWGKQAIFYCKVTQNANACEDFRR